ncbi:MAG: hypothetical protein RL189_1784 [Pseudomonadota bacterium]
MPPISREQAKTFRRVSRAEHERFKQGLGRTKKDEADKAKPITVIFQRQARQRVHVQKHKIRACLSRQVRLCARGPELHEQVCQMVQRSAQTFWKIIDTFRPKAIPVLLDVFYPGTNFASSRGMDFLT